MQVSQIFINSIEVHEGRRGVRISQNSVDLDNLTFYSCLMFVAPQSEEVVDAWLHEERNVTV